VLLIVLIAWLHGPALIAILPWPPVPPGSADHRHGQYAWGLASSHALFEQEPSILLLLWRPAETTWR
jgi:hypothetical protein